MFEILKSLFSKKNIQPTTIAAHEEAPTITPVTKYFEEELANCTSIKKEFHTQVMKHLTHEASLTKTKNTLTSEEKRALGINTRLSITRELIEVLTDEGLALANPKALLEEIYNRATIKKSRNDSFASAIDAGIKKFKLHAAGDKSECEWCRKNSGKEFDQTILQKMQINCTCKPYSKCFFTPVIEF